MPEVTRRATLKAGLFTTMSVLCADLFADDRNAPELEKPQKLFSAGKDGKWGFINANGELVVPLKYKRVGDFAEGLAVVATDKGQGYIDSNGNEVIPPTLYFAGNFSEGLANCRLTKTESGYIRLNGSVAFKEPEAPTAVSCGEFSEGLATVHLGGAVFADYDYWGFMDMTGKLVIPPVFSVAAPFRDGLALVSMNSELGSGSFFFITKTGTVAFGPAPRKRTTLAAQSFSEGLAAVKWYTIFGGEWGYIDREGKLAFELAFGDARHFSEGLAAVMDKETAKWGYINKSGELKIDYKFDFADRFSDGHAVVGVGNNKAFIDKTGAFTMEPRKFNGFFGSFSGGLIDFFPSGAGLANNSYFDQTGKQVWPTE